MRELKSVDVIALIRILTKVDIRSDLTEISKKIVTMNIRDEQVKKLKAEGEEVPESLIIETDSVKNELGIYIPLLFIEAFPKAEKEITKFLGSLTEKEFETLSADELLDLIEEIKGDEDFKKVFSKALKLLKG